MTAPPSKAAALAGLTVLSFESRRATEIGKLIAGHGGRTITAPSMREIPLSETDETRRFLDELRAGRIDIVILMTGVGTNALVEILAPRCPVDELRTLLEHPVLIARGPKPRAALRAIDCAPDHTVGEPNTWREIVDLTLGLGPLDGKVVAIQEYGRRNQQLCDALGEAGASVLPVPVYRWALPEDLEPLHRGIRALAAGEVDVSVFTSAQQCHHVFDQAAALGISDAVQRGLANGLTASVGPVCSAELRSRRIQVDIEPTTPKMGPLIKAIANQAALLLAEKRR